MRILIATVTAGAGHVQAAAALEEAWMQIHPSDTVERVDVLQFTSRLFKKAYSDGYMKLAEHLPDLYSLLFKKTDNPALLRKLTQFRRSAAEAPTRKFTQHLKQFNPDIVLCTHFLPPEVLGKLRAVEGEAFEIKVATVVTDFEAHALWTEPGVDLYCVATDATKARMTARGLNDNKIEVTGIPIAGRFSSNINGAALRKQMGWRDDLPILLVLSGGFGMGPVAEILAELNKYESPVQVVVVCGRNEDLRRELAVKVFQHPTHVLGFVTNMHELMSVSELVFSKPGGLTTSEALALGKPLFIINPIPGQEAANSDFLLEQGAAVKANRIEDIPFKLKQVMNPSKLAELSRAAKSLGKPGAARAVVEAVRTRFS